MPLYEHVFLARQDASPQQVEELTSQMTGIVQQLGDNVHVVTPARLLELIQQVERD